MSNIYEINYIDYAYKIIPWHLRDYDYEIEEGDFKIRNTHEQESYFILKSSKGQFYSTLKIGVGLEKYINADIDKNDLRKKIRDALELDEFKINKIYLITASDVEELGITDVEILSKIENNGFIISLDILR